MDGYLSRITYVENLYSLDLEYPNSEVRNSVVTNSEVSVLNFGPVNLNID